MLNLHDKSFQAIPIAIRKRMVLDILLKLLGLAWASVNDFDQINNFSNLKKRCSFCLSVFCHTCVSAHSFETVGYEDF